MAKTTELVTALDEELAIDRFTDGQVNGLQVQGGPDIDRMVAAVSCNQATIDAAVEAGAQALLTHHGLLWGTGPMDLRGPRRVRTKTLLEHDINLLSYHLPLDAHTTLGNNAALADLAGCDAEPAFAVKGTTLGMQGRLPEARPFKDWVTGFEAALRDDCTVDTGPFQVWPFGPDQVETIGFVSGAAPYQVEQAIDAGCDVYVTGEAAESVYHVAKEAGIHFIAGGHYLTERGGVQRLGDWIAKRFGVEVDFADVETRV